MLEHRQLTIPPTTFRGKYLTIVILRINKGV